ISGSTPSMITRDGTRSGRGAMRKRSWLVMMLFRYLQRENLKGRFRRAVLLPRVVVTAPREARQGSVQYRRMPRDAGHSTWDGHARAGDTPLGSVRATGWVGPLAGMGPPRQPRGPGDH